MISTPLRSSLTNTRHFQQTQELVMSLLYDLLATDSSLQTEEVEAQDFEDVTEDEV